MTLPTVKRPCCINCEHWYGPPALVAFTQGPEAKHFCHKQNHPTTRDMGCSHFVEGLREPEPGRFYCSECGARIHILKVFAACVNLQEVSITKQKSSGPFRGKVTFTMPVFSNTSQFLCDWCRKQTSEDEK